MPDNLQNLKIEEANRLTLESQQGEALEAFKANDMPILEDTIFKEIEREAMNTLKNPELDMTNLNQLYQLRALCQATDLIRKRIDAKIARGKNARVALQQLIAPPQEGE